MSDPETGARTGTTGPGAEDNAGDPDSGEKIGWLRRLTRGLGRSSSKLTQGLTDLFTKRRLDEAALEDLEDLLIGADLGVEAAQKVVEGMRSSRFGKEVEAEEIRAALAEEIEAILAPVAKPLDIDPNKRPFTILVAGVNGAGKTTTIGKLAKRFREQGLSVTLAAGDTFRAAAIEQLTIWGERSNSPVIARETGADAAGLAYDALQTARTDGSDVLLIDTAGRLQNRTELMEELKKIVRVIKKLDETAPHATLLVLDATVGQNAHSQVKTFKEMVDVTGLAVTKLDGTAKGGVVVALADAFGLPVHAVGVGEKADDLRPFSARAYARGLLGLPAED